MILTLELDMINWYTAWDVVLVLSTPIHVSFWIVKQYCNHKTVTNINKIYMWSIATQGIYFDNIHCTVYQSFFGFLSSLFSYFWLVHCFCSYEKWNVHRWSRMIAKCRTTHNTHSRGTIYTRMLDTVLVYLFCYFGMLPFKHNLN